MHTRHTIAYRMARIIAYVTLCLGLLIGTLQVIWDYQLRQRTFNEQIQNLMGSVEKAAVKAVYTFDSGLAVEVANGLFEFPPISNVLILDENNSIMASLQRYRGDLPFTFLSNFLFHQEYKYSTLLYLPREPNQIIGKVEITAVPHEMAQAFFKQALIILSLAMIQAFIIALVLFYAFHHRVTRPLRLLANDFRQINPETPAQSTLSLAHNLRGSEFEDVTAAGMKMLQVIDSHLKSKSLAEQELKRQKDENERFLQIAEAIILQLDNQGRVTMINQRGLDVMGYREKELIGQNWFEIAIPAESRERLKISFDDLFFNAPKMGAKTSFSNYMETDILTKSREKRRIYWHNARETNRDGDTVGILSSGQDITERKKAEDALRATEGSLRAIIEATSEGFAIIDNSRMELFDVNSSLCQLLGYNREEMLFAKVDKVVHAQDLAILTSYFQETDSLPHKTYELRLMRCDGKPVPVEINLSKLPFDSDNTPRTVAFITNITKRREQEIRQKTLEQQLRQAQKMETIGTLAGGIAHDFNNILTPILGYSSLLVSRINPEDPNHARIQQIAKSAKRGADMIKQILSFSRRSESERESRYLAPIIEDSLQLVKATLPSNIEIKADIPKNCPPAFVDHTQIQQLVLNLCTNANQAMNDDGGILSVSLQHCQVTSEVAETSPMLQEGPYLKLTVSDTGHGMDEETMHRIFDPFYTTKESGKGTGLGLAMVHAIVQEHKGDIFVTSSKNHGSTFIVYLPVCTSPVDETTTQEDIIEGNMECALVVDDEELNTSFLEELLEDVGYSFEIFNNSQDALEAFKADPDKFQIVLTDQTMPKMNGTQLVNAIHEIRPNIPVIMMSGYDQSISIENAEEFGIDRFITKPVSIDKLTRAMHELLHP